MNVVSCTGILRYKWTASKMISSNSLSKSFAPDCMKHFPNKSLVDWVDVAPHMMFLTCFLGADKTKKQTFDVSYRPVPSRRLPTIAGGTPGGLRFPWWDPNLKPSWMPRLHPGGWIPTYGTSTNLNLIVNSKLKIHTVHEAFFLTKHVECTLVFCRNPWQVVRNNIVFGINHHMIRCLKLE